MLLRLVSCLALVAAMVVAGTDFHGPRRSLAQDCAQGGEFGDCYGRGDGGWGDGGRGNDGWGNPDRGDNRRPRYDRGSDQRRGDGNRGRVFRDLVDESSGRSGGGEGGGTGRGEGGGTGRGGGNGGRGDFGRGAPGGGGGFDGAARRAPLERAIPSPDDLGLSRQRDRLRNGGGSGGGGGGGCLSSREARGAVQSGEASPLGAISRGIGGDIVSAQLCRAGGRLVYVVNVMADDGRVRRLRVDAQSGDIIGGR